MRTIASWLTALSKMGTWDDNGMVAPVNIGQKKPSDCFYLQTITPDAKWVRMYPTDKLYDCTTGPFVPQSQLG